MQPLIARDREVSLIRQLFEQGQWLVAIVGPAGVGKTRLLQAFAGAAPRSEIVDLASATVRRGVWTALRRRVTDDPGRVIALDGLDHHRVIARRELASWDLRPGSAQVLIAVRQRLGVADEAVVPLAPLDAASGVTLLLARASAAGVSFADREHDALEAIVHAVGGFPLAIEHAARRLRSIDARALLDRLASDPLRELYGRGAAAASLAAAWAAFTKPDRQAMERLAAFAGAFDLQAVMAALSTSEDAARTRIESLLDASGIHPAQGSSRTFTLYPPYRWLAVRDAKAHRSWNEAVLAHARFVTGQPPSAVDPLELETVVSRASDDPAPAMVDRGVRAMLGLVECRPADPRALELVAAIQQRAVDPSDALALARARADLLRSFDRIEEALETVDAALARAIGAHDVERARALEARCVLLRRLRRFDDAATAGEEAALLYRALRSPRYARALGAIGAIAIENGDHALAFERFHEVERMARRAGDEHGVTLAIGFQGHVWQEMGAPVSAASAYRRAADGFARLGDERLAAAYAGYLGTAMEEQEQIDAAASHYQEAWKRLERIGAPAFAKLFESCWAAVSNAGAVEESAIDDPGIAAAVGLHLLRLRLATAEDGHRSGAASIGLRDVSDDVRFALRRLARLRAERAPAGARTLQVARGIVSIDMGSGAPEVVDLSARRVLWRLLEQLIASHLAEPGHPVPRSELVRAGWGDERMLPDAAAHRVRVAMSELRTKGLAPVFRDARSEGYALRPDVVVGFV